MRIRAAGKKLIRGLELKLFQPELYARDCNHCRKFLYDEKLGEPVPFGDSFVERGPDQLPPCDGRGCPKGHWSEPLQLTPENEEAYEHYLECEATFRFPDDALVARNARIIKSVVDRFREHKRHLNLTETILASHAR